VENFTRDDVDARCTTLMHCYCVSWWLMLSFENSERVEHIITVRTVEPYDDDDDDDDDDDNDDMMMMMMMMMMMLITSPFGQLGLWAPSSGV
jgi:hypothetical protein